MIYDKVSKRLGIIGTLSFEDGDLDIRQVGLIEKLTPVIKSVSVVFSFSPV